MNQHESIQPTPRNRLGHYPNRLYKSRLLSLINESIEALRTEARRVVRVVDDNEPVRVLAMSASSRRASSNAALGSAVADLARDSSMAVSIYGELEELPPFNPELDGDRTPAKVTRFRAALRACDAVLISSPDAVDGHEVMKNALDWVADSGELIDKPVALINASPRPRHAWASLAETPAVISARVIVKVWITVPLDGGGLDANGSAGDDGLSNALTSAIGVLAAATRDAQQSPRAAGVRWWRFESRYRRAS
jgi:NAD(P)H-dependent FMN reductase